MSLTALSLVTLAACAHGSSEPVPAPEPVVVTRTVTVTACPAEADAAIPTQPKVPDAASVTATPAYQAWLSSVLAWGQGLYDRAVDTRKACRP